MKNQDQEKPAVHDRASGDAMFKYDKEGVPVSRDPYEDTLPESSKKRPQTESREGTEDAAKRSETGTGL